MIYFDAPFLTVHAVGEGNIIWAEWKGTPTREPMDRGFEAGEQAVIANKSHRWLADTRFLGTMDPLEVKWVNEHWIPRLVKAGVRSMALVAPAKVVMQVQVKSFMARIDERDLALSYFSNIDEAWIWLRAQP